MLNAVDLDIGFIGSQGFGWLVLVVVYKGLDYSSCSHCIVCNGGMRYIDTVDIPEGIGSSPGGKIEIDMIGKTKPHDMRTEFPEIEVDSSFWKRVKIHLHEFDGEFPVDVAKFEFVLLFSYLFERQPFKLFQIIWTVVIQALVDVEFFSLLDERQGTSAVGTLENCGFVDVMRFLEGSSANLTLILAFIAIVVVEVNVGSTALWTGYVFGNTLVLASLDRLKRFTVHILVIPDEKLIVHFFKAIYFGKPVYLEFVVLGAVGIIEELFQWYIFQDEIKKIRNNL